MSVVKRLFWDIETSPNIHYSWRAGNKVFLSHDSILQERVIICIGYKWEHERKTNCLVWDHWDDSNIIKEFTKIANEADELVAHFGDRFDMRWFKGRNLINRLPPLPDYKTVDTCKIASKHFYLNSNKLDYLAQILFGEGKIKTEFGLWKKICKTNDKTSLDRMVRYCKKDVILLERVWKELEKYDAPKTHAGVIDGLDRWTCPGCGSKEVALNKTRTTSKGIIQKQMQCNDCHRYYSIADSVFTRYLVAKNRENSNARA